MNGYNDVFHRKEVDLGGPVFDSIIGAGCAFPEGTPKKKHQCLLKVGDDYRYATYLYDAACHANNSYVGLVFNLW